ncbi:unnamed protein product [Ophioblennius macclurei]
MAPKGGPCFLLLIVACAVLATPSDAKGRNKPNYNHIVKKMMTQCREKGYDAPNMSLLKSIFSQSNMEGADGDQAEILLSGFLNVLKSATEGKTDTNNRAPMKDPSKMKNKALKCRDLSAILKKIRGTPEASACYLRAFMAPAASGALSAECKDQLDSTDFEVLLWAAQPMMEKSPSARKNLPSDLDAEKMKPMMKLLQDVYTYTTDSEKSWMANWAKNQIVQNTHNCTMKPASDPTSTMRKPCKAPEKQLSLEVLTVMGGYMSHMVTVDIDLTRKEKVCDFFQSGLLDMMKGTRPTKCRWFLKTYQDCFSETEFQKHLDKLGPLTCCLSNVPDLPPDVSTKVLSQLENCNNSMTRKLKKRLVKLYMLSRPRIPQALLNLGKNAKFLDPRSFLNMDPKILKEVLKNNSLQWTPKQQCMLVRKQLGDKCDKMSFEELKDAPSIAKAVPVCSFKNMKADEILKDPEVLRNISRKMRKSQLKAMLQKLPPDVLKKNTMPQRLGCAASLRALQKANITSLEQTENKTWCRSQAAFLAKMMKKGQKVNFRKLRFILRGITCKIIENASEIKELAEVMAEAPEWVSKTQVRCAARKLFATLEKERKDYFKSVTEAELENVPTAFLLHLPPSKLKDLPESVCPTFLDMLEEADLSSLPPRAWSRPALISRALRCLANETDLSGLTITDVSMLGRLVCDFPPSKLTLLASDVLNSTLERMAECEYIPKRHQKELIKLVKKTYGDPSEWEAETAETIGPLLDEDSTYSLPNKPGMKDAVFYLMSLKRQTSNALLKKWFELATDQSSDTTGKKSPITNPTEEMIEEVGRGSCFWTPSQLDGISTETFRATVETLGSCSSYSAEQLAVLRKKVTQAFGSVERMAKCQVTQMGCITRSFNPTELETLPFSLDSLEEVSKCGWTEEQVRSVWKGVAKRENLKAAELGSAEMVDLSQFICGLDSDEIQQLNVDAFMDAVGSMDGIRCAKETMQRFKKVAMSAFGPPGRWGEAEASELSTIVPELDASELGSMNSSVFSFIDEKVIPNIPPGNLKALSDDQLRSFGPDNAEAVTSAQIGELSVSQRVALDEAATGSRSMSETSEDSGQASGQAAGQSAGQTSGAPSVYVEGIPALMTPFLFLCMGFLLL